MFRKALVLGCLTKSPIPGKGWALRRWGNRSYRRPVTKARWFIKPYIKKNVDSDMSMRIYSSASLLPNSLLAVRVSIIYLLSVKEKLLPLF